MDENTNHKIEELKKNPPSRFFPVLLIPVAVAGLFCYRVATTDPRWNATAPQSTAKPAAATSAPTVRPLSSSPSPAAKPAAESTTRGEAVPASKSVTAPETVANDQPAASATATNDQPAPAAAESSEGSTLDDYLAKHLGKSVPFLHKGETRTVTLAAFDDDTVTIKLKKSFTLKRSDLSPEQLALWK